MKKYLMAIDQGTTSTRAILVDYNGNIVAKAQHEVECLYPQPGWVEVNPNKVWLSVIDSINEALVDVNCTMNEIASIGITNQRETTIVWDRKTGQPVYNGIVWQSKQTQQLCNERNQYMELIQKKTGLRMNPYFSASKIRFILDQIENGQQRAENGELMFGTVDSWIIYKLTIGRMHATDVSNASRTMLFDIFNLKWDEELLKIWDIPEKMLPKVLENADDYGEALYFPGYVPIRGVAGDQQAALFGQCCFEMGESKNTYGTGCFLLMNIGEEKMVSKQGLLTTIAWKLNGKTTYALEGSVFVGGAIIQWLRDEMKLIDSSSESESKAMLVKDTAGVYVVPAFVGLGTPYWDDEARGAVFGLTRGANRNHFIRASLFSIAYQSMDLIEAMKKEVNIEQMTLKVDGGAIANNLLMQFQSDILQCNVDRPSSVETTALGAAYLAGLGCGFFNDLDDIKNKHQIEKTFTPQMDAEEASSLYEGWKCAIESTIRFKPNK